MHKILRTNSIIEELNIVIIKIKNFIKPKK